MKIIGRKFSSPVTLLPLDQFQRELLSGISSVLIWFVATYWTYWSSYKWWNGGPMSPLLQNAAEHYKESSQDILRSAFGFTPSTPRDLIGTATDATFSVLPTVLSLALAASAVIMILSAFKIIAYPKLLRWFGPVALGSIIFAMLIVPVLMPLFSAITDVIFPLKWVLAPHGFSIAWGDWLGFLVDTLTKLAVPFVVLLVSLVPIFAPTKKSR